MLCCLLFNSCDQACKVAIVIGRSLPYRQDIYCSVMFGDSVYHSPFAQSNPTEFPLKLGGFERLT
jgi:hypothetical protein